MRSALSQYTTISNMKTTKSKSRIYLKNVLIYGTELLQSTREPKVLECPFVLQRPSSPIFEGSSEIEFNES